MSASPENLKRCSRDVITVMRESELNQLLSRFQEGRERSTAASVLGSLPKKQRKIWSGWIGQDRCWRGRRVIIPGGKVGRVYGAVRNQVAVQWDDPFALHPVRAAI